MEDQVHDLLAFVLQVECGLTKARATRLAAHFTDVEEFLTATRVQLSSISSVSGRQALRLKDTELVAIVELQESGHLDAALSISENYVAALGRDFTKRQVDRTRGISLANLTPNPFLIASLGLATPADVVHLNVYMLVTRSVVTSMGFLVERLLRAMSPNVGAPPRGTGWDAVHEDEDGRSWLQVKSGPNDMDKDQVVYWAEKIAEKVGEGDKAYIGITYGKPSMSTITFSHFRQWLPDWELRTLIGRQLWEFVADGDSEAADRVLNSLRRAAQQILQGQSLEGEIISAIERLVEEFETQHGRGVAGVQAYIESIF